MKERPARRTRWKTALLAVAAIAAAAVIAACSSGTTGTTGTTGTGSSAAGGGAVKVGVICDCSGALASDIADGAKIYQAWADSVNAAGGINGHQVQVILDDDDSNPGTSLNDVQTLVRSDHIAALVDLSNLDETWASFVKSQGVPVIGANVSTTPMYTNSDFYPEGMTEDALFAGIIDAAKRGGATNLGLLYCAEAVQCQEAVAPLKAATQKQGLPLAYNGEISATAPSYTAQCVAAQQGHVTALFIADIEAVAAKVATDCSQQGYHPLYVIDGLDLSPTFATTPGLKDNLAGPSDDLPLYASSPAITAMNAALDKYYPGLRKDPYYDEAVTNAWTSGLLLEAAAKAGGLGANGSPTSAELVKGLTALKGNTLDGTAPPLTFTAGQPHTVDCWYNYALKNGKFTLPDGTSTTCENA
jgi:branched-chain amino acid transport system substrate-binding protein